MMFDPAPVKSWVDLVSGLLAVIGGVLAALWAYSKYIVERGLIPSTQFSVDCVPLGRQRDMTIVEIVVRLKNCGTSTLIAGNVRVDVRTMDESDAPKLFNDATSRGFGRLIFPASLRHGLTEVAGDGQRGILLLDYDTFVQAGVEQQYSFITAVPSSTTFALVWASFQYAQRPSAFQKAVLWSSRRLGLVQWSLAHVNEPHTVERAFPVAARTGGVSVGTS